MSTPSVKIGNITKVIHYNPEKQFAILLVHPADWKKGNIKVMGNFDHAPEINEMVKVSGEIKKEPWTDKDGNPHLSEKGKELFNYVMEKAHIEEPGKRMSIIGEVEKVINSNEYNSIVLVRPNGFQYPMKVFAPIPAKEGGLLIADGFKDKVPYMKDGEHVKDDEGNPKFSTVLRATTATCQMPKEYSGPISRVLRWNEENHNATVLFNPGFRNNKDVKAYINIEEQPVVGATLSVMGVTDNEAALKDGNPIFKDDGNPLTNLVIRGVSCHMTPAEIEFENETPPDDVAPDEDEKSSSPSM